MMISFTTGTVATSKELTNWSVVRHSVGKTKSQYNSLINLIYLEAEANYSWLYWHDGHRSLTSRTLKYHHDRLPAGQFVRLNRMVLINYRFIERVERISSGYTISLSTGKSFMVSRRRWQTVRQNLLDRWNENLSFSGKRDSILLIEDNEDQQIIMQYLLKKQFQEVKAVGATTAGQAWDYLDACRIEKLDFPKLILLDLHLPKREDGWQLLRQLRNHPLYQHIPVIMVSYSGDQKDMEESYYWGASGYLTKPMFGQDWSDHLTTIWYHWQNTTVQS